MAGVDELSVVAQDYLKVIWASTEWGGKAITTTELAAKMGTSSPNVSDTLRRLASQGLVDYQPYHPVQLTSLGEEMALAMVRRHRLIESFLAEILGYEWHEVHAEAERLEHAVSDEFLARIDALLGYPTRDPHGDRIPQASGMAEDADALPLSEARPGKYEVVRVSDSDPAVLDRLNAAGVLPGVEVDLSELAVDPDDLAAVRARPV